MKTELTQEGLKRVLHYEPETGLFTWLVARGRVSAGATAGSIKTEPDGRLYSVIRVYGRTYLAHRLAWLYVHGIWPELGLDHRDTDGLNNRIDNLREATIVENGQNAKLSRRNKLGRKGVFWNTEKRKWTTRIRINGRNVHLGHFHCPDEAAAAYRAAAMRWYGEFARF